MQFFILIRLKPATSGLYISIKYRKLFLACLFIPGIGNPVISFSATRQTVFVLCNKNNYTKTILFVDGILTLGQFELQIFREMNKFLYGRSFCSCILGFVAYLNGTFAKERKNVGGGFVWTVTVGRASFSFKYRSCLKAAYQVASCCCDGRKINEVFNADGSKTFVLRKTRGYYFILHTVRPSVRPSVHQCTVPQGIINSFLFTTGLQWV